MDARYEVKHRQIAREQHQNVHTILAQFIAPYNFTGWLSNVEYFVTK